MKVSGELDIKERKRHERKRFLEPDLSFDDMFRQSCARVNFMQTRRNAFYHPTNDPDKFELPKKAEKYLSRFKYNLKVNKQRETYFIAASRTNRKEDAQKYKEEADKYLTKCLHAHYVIGVLYGEFMAGAAPVV